ncbi:MAG TPA: O-antigen ligase family protein [Limnobacter sp.]|nr:O-antigen ligase family protein [Limnobacter sp.]
MRKHSFYLPGFAMLTLWLPTAWSNLAMALVLVAVLAEPAMRARLVQAMREPVVLGAVGFWLLLGASSLYSVATLQEDLDRWMKYKEFLWLPLFAALCSDDAHKQQALKGFLLGATLVLAISCLGYWGYSNALPQWLLKQTALGDSDGPVVFKLAITHNFLMGLAVCAYLLAAWQNPRWRLPLAMLAGLALFNVLAMVNGRTGYLVLLAAFVYAFYWRFGYKGVALGMALTLPLCVLVYQQVPTVNNAVGEGLREVQRWATQPTPNPTGSMEMRLNWWAASAEAIEQKPWLGYGVGGYSHAYAAVRNPAVHLPNSNPHNQYVLFAVELGLVGLGVFLLWWLALWATIDRALKTASAQARLHLRFAHVVWLAFGLACVVNSFFLDHTEGVLIQAMLGMFALANTSQTR